MELSDHAKEMLENLRAADPWAMVENIPEKVTAEYNRIAKGGVLCQEDKDPEDVIAYVGAYLNAWFIVMMDHMADYEEEVLDGMKEQYQALQGVERAAKPDSDVMGWCQAPIHFHSMAHYRTISCTDWKPAPKGCTCGATTPYEEGGHHPDCEGLFNWDEIQAMHAYEPKHMKEA